jgi:methylated-DNA-[protein]-cysteine S-methyltransferase
MTAVSIPTALGIFTAGFSDQGLATLDFPDRATLATTGVPPELGQSFSVTKSALEAVFSGSSPGELPPLDLRAGTEFQRAVWRALLNIPVGHTRTYADIASEIGAPKATRAVGGACGANPIPVLIPCHRVLASGEKIGGFSAGLDWKRRLLAIEGISLSKTEDDLQRRLF